MALNTNLTKWDVLRAVAIAARPVDPRPYVTVTKRPRLPVELLAELDRAGRPDLRVTYLRAARALDR